MKYVCPFCYKVKPQSAEPSVWACCGKVGHAIVLPACPRCGAEFFDPPKPCEVCGYQTMQNTPRTDAVQNEADNAHYRDGAWRPFSPTEDKGWAFARQLERELHAVTVCAGVASKERGEWADERAALLESLTFAKTLLRRVLTHGLDEAHGYAQEVKAGELHTAISMFLHKDGVLAAGKPRSGDVVSGETNA